MVMTSNYAVSGELPLYGLKFSTFRSYNLYAHAHVYTHRYIADIYRYIDIYISAIYNMLYKFLYLNLF